MKRLDPKLDHLKREALARLAVRRRRAREHRRELAADYAAEAGDLPDLLDAEAGQLDLLEGAGLAQAPDDDVPE